MRPMPRDRIGYAIPILCAAPVCFLPNPYAKHWRVMSRERSVRPRFVCALTRLSESPPLGGMRNASLQSVEARLLGATVVRV